MQLTYRLMLAGLAVVGVAVGVSFGLGVAYGKGDTKTVDTGLTQQQILALVGGGTGGTSGTGNARAGATSTAGGTGNSTGNSTIGTVTAVEGNSVTVQTAQGSTKVTISGNTTVQTLSTGKASDLKVGDLVVAAGNRGSDGSVAASSLSALPAALSGLLGGGARQGTTP